MKYISDNLKKDGGDAKKGYSPMGKIPSGIDRSQPTPGGGKASDKCSSSVPNTGKI